MDMYGYGSTHMLGDIYPGAGAGTQEKVNPRAAKDTSMASLIGQSGAALSGSIGLPLPVLLTLGVLAVALIRLYD